MVRPPHKNCNSGPGTWAVALTRSGPLKKKFVGKRYRRLSQAGEHVPTSVPQWRSSAAMFNFKGASGEKGARCGLPMKSAALAQGGEQWPLLSQDPSKKNFTGE